MVFTDVTIDGLTHEMWLPVMNGANAAMKDKPYQYQVMQWQNGKKVSVTKDCAAADMFDINKTIMRCLVKNLAMFGLGLYIYAGEDLPEQAVEGIPKPLKQPVSKTPPVIKVENTNEAVIKAWLEEHSIDIKNFGSTPESAPG